MGFEVRTLPSFEKDVKLLLRKYPSLKKDLLLLIDSLEIQPIQGISLGNDFYKIRLAIRSKGKGKSGGQELLLVQKLFRRKFFLLLFMIKLTLLLFLMIH
jgi:hypothetical protein